MSANGATDEVRADPVALAVMASDFLTASEELGTALQDAQADFPPAAAAFGNTAGAAAVYQQAESATERTGTTVELLKEVIEGDVDRIYQVAFAYQQADEASAEDICRPGRPC